VGGSKLPERGMGVYHPSLKNSGLVEFIGFFGPRESREMWHVAYKSYTTSYFPVGSEIIISKRVMNKYKILDGWTR